MESEALLKLHLEPENSIEVAELVDALGALSREFRSFCVSRDLTTNPNEARLLVSSVSPGSIDISFLPELAAITTGALLPVIEQLALVRKFAEHIKWLLDGFLSRSSDESAAESSITECDDAINLVKPIANNGGNQTITVVKGDQITNILNITGNEARRITNNAAKARARLKGQEQEIAQRVPLVFSRLDIAKAKVEGPSPDKAVIEELDPKPHPVLFTDEMIPIKKAMIDEQIRPFKKVYFVDVQVSRIGGKIVSYRIVGYHGNDDL